MKNGRREPDLKINGLSAVFAPMDIKEPVQIGEASERGGNGMARFDFSFFQLLFKILGRQTGEISKVDYTPQKPHFEGLPIEQPFERATPESQGISSERVKEFLLALDNDEEANPHHAMLLRHGKVIAECGYAPYERNMWHITHSMCKSVTGMAIGLLIDEGKLSLDERLVEIFPRYAGIFGLLRLREVTIKNLLNMTSEVEFSESGAISGNDWRLGFMSSNLKADPGSKFAYNSMNSYMLSAVVTERTGLSMYDYLQPKLFQPLGINEVFWEKCPQGITKGGWGMFLKPEDAAKLGQLYLNKGRWNGQQIIPESWVEASTKKQVDNGRFGYGYQLWLEDRPGGYAYNGMLGQDVIIYPDDDMILMINAGNREMTQAGHQTDIVRRFWGLGYEPADVLPEDPAAQAALKNCIKLLEGRGSFVSPIERGGWRKRPCPRPGISEYDLIRMLSGRSYELDQQHIGVFPLVMQVFHNNFTDGISRISFGEEDENLTVLLKEGEETHKLIVGIGRAEKTEITVHGEPYYAATTGRIATDEKGRLTLVLNIAFLEEACSRQIKLYFMDSRIEVRASERPGDDIISDGLSYISDAPALTKIPVLGNIMEGGGADLLDAAIQTTIHPVTFGHLVKQEDAEQEDAEEKDSERKDSERKDAEQGITEQGEAAQEAAGQKNAE